MLTHKVDSLGNIEITEKGFISRKKAELEAVLDVFSKALDIPKNDFIVLKGHSYEHCKICWLTANKAESKNIPKEDLYSIKGLLYEMQVTEIDVEFNLFDGKPIRFSVPETRKYSEFEKWAKDNAEYSIREYEAIVKQYFTTRMPDKEADILTALKYSKEDYSTLGEKPEKLMNALDDIFKLVDDAKEWSNNANRFFYLLETKEPVTHIYDCFVELKEFLKDVEAYEVVKVHYKGSAITIDYKENDKDMPSKQANIYLRTEKGHIYYLLDSNITYYESMRELKKYLSTENFLYRHAYGSEINFYISEEDLGRVREKMVEPIPYKVPTSKPLEAPKKEQEKQSNKDTSKEVSQASVFGKVPKIPGLKNINKER